jgi:Bax protein
MKLLSNRSAGTLMLAVMVGFAMLPLWLAQQDSLRQIESRLSTANDETDVRPALSATAPSVSYAVVDLAALSSGLEAKLWKPVPLPNFKKYRNVEKKKKAFFDFLYPVIRDENQVLLGIRWRLLRDIDWTLPQHAEWLIALGESYRVPAGATINETRLQLLEKIDVVPPSLAMAQAAKDSLWGTSRFARVANNLFGERCHTRGCGIVPRNRSGRSTYEIQRYADVGGSVADYIHSLNSSPKLREFRRLRRIAREEVRFVYGDELVLGLKRYSSRGDAYVAELQSALFVNNLVDYDKQMLKDLIELMRASDY